jgi:hypothetical protein
MIILNKRELDVMNSYKQLRSKNDASYLFPRKLQQIKIAQ